MEKDIHCLFFDCPPPLIRIVLRQFHLVASLLDLSYPQSIEHQSNFLPRSTRIPWKDFCAELMHSTLVFCNYRVELIVLLLHKEWSAHQMVKFNRRSQGVWPSASRSCTFRKKQQHSVASSHQLSWSPDWNNTDEVPSEGRRTARSAMNVVSDLCGVFLSWSTTNSRELSVLMDLGFPFLCKNVRRLLCVSWADFDLHE